MRNKDELHRENDALRERLSRLSEASLRINETLDFDTVLQEVLDSARGLTGARYGVITTVDESGRMDDVLTSGLSPQESEDLLAIPEGARLFEYFSGMQESLRLTDLSGYVRALGFQGFDTPVKANTFLGTPLHHRGSQVGSFYLGGKESGPEFGSEDEETLVMFASQAALVIANARRHRDEQRARADLETLVNTAPVGVVVIDARTGIPGSINREATRIVEGLLMPGGTAKQLMEVVTIRRADGRELSLEDLSVAQALGNGETVRAEEIVLRVPDGRSVTILMNATPIRSEEGELESLIVTMQDMTPLEELERLRAEFLGMVSHELRTPLTSIKGSAATLLEFLSTRDSTETVQLVRIIEGQANRMRDLINDLLDVAHIETGALSVVTEPADLADLVDEARNTFLSAGGRGNIRMELPPDLPLVMADRRRIVQVLNNLLSNAARHSPESSAIRVNVITEDIHIAISVTDEGRGISAESLPLLFQKFSRLRHEDWGGDTGLGLAICKGIVEAHGGRIHAESDGPGLGARFTFTLPVAEAAQDRSLRAVPSVALGARRAASTRPRILTVDDDPQTLRYVRYVLSKAGFATVMTADPHDVSRLMREEEPNLVLLDLMLPGIHGMELMKEILEIADVPVIFLSAYGQDETIARAFEAGATDYVVKPFSPTELVARIDAALRKWMPGLRQSPEPFALGELTIDYDARRVSLADRVVRLTATEFDLLRELSVNAGRVLTHEHLLRQVWGHEYSGDSGPTRTIVKRLRRKLGDDARDPTYIFAEPRIGYRMPKGEAAKP